MNGSEIRDVSASMALDSRGTPTVASRVVLASGATGRATAPAGASAGSHEAAELRDGGARYAGRGVSRAVEHVNSVLADAVRGIDAADQSAVDSALRACDGTANLARLGANAVLAVSVAASLAAAEHVGQPPYRWWAVENDPLLPLPMINIFSGGAHAAGALDVQDVLVVPLGAATFSEAIAWVWEVRHHLQCALADSGHPARLVADEGGFGVRLESNRQALELVTEAIAACGLVPGEQVAIALDIAANELLSVDRYVLGQEGRRLRAAAFVEELVDWCREFPVISVEDPMAEDDWSGWRLATDSLDHLQLVGDDLFVTAKDRLERGIRDGIANTVLVKPNQCGTLAAACDVVDTARAAGYATVLSARSGETEETWLADLAVGWRAGQIKVGSLTRSERTAKWNRLLAIEDELGPGVEYAGGAALAGRHLTDHAWPDRASHDH